MITHPGSKDTYSELQLSRVRQKSIQETLAERERSEKELSRALVRANVATEAKTRYKGGIFCGI